MKNWSTLTVLIMVMCALAIVFTACEQNGTDENFLGSYKTLEPEYCTEMYYIPDNAPGHSYDDATAWVNSELEELAEQNKTETASLLPEKCSGSFEGTCNAQSVYEADDEVSVYPIHYFYDAAVGSDMCDEAGADWTDL